MIFLNIIVSFESFFEFYFIYIWLRRYTFKMENGFWKADLQYLPAVVVIIVSEFLAMSKDFNQPQSSGVKAKY